MGTLTFTLNAFLSVRSVVGDTLHELGMKHDNVWGLTADTGGSLKAFKQDCRERYIDVGIAEQNLVGIAAGLALEGNIPYIMGMIPFMTMRAYEQIRTAVCYHNLPVRFIGTGGGLTSGGGSTHNAMEDINIMKSIVNMSVVSIADPNMVRDILIESMTYKGPLYIRLTQGKKDRVLYEPSDKQEYEIGRGLLVRSGRDATIFAHGEMVFEGIIAAEELAKDGINVQVVDMYSIKPLDTDLLFQAIKDTGKILVLEDHLMMGGLASSIADAITDSGIYPKKFKRLGIPQVYAGFGSGPELRAKYGYDSGAAVAAIKEMLN